jgi:hypothetical protein
MTATMNQTVNRPPSDSSSAPDTSPRAGIIGLLWESAVKALPQAIGVIVLGNVAVGLVGGIWRQMAPTLPPGMDGSSLLTAQRSISSTIQSSAIKEHQFLIVYAIFFAHAVRVRLFGKSLAREDNATESTSYGATRQISREWFRVIVGNAFGALFSAIALFWVQKFSLSQAVWHAMLQPVITHLQNAASYLFGESLSGTGRRWAGWYGENQFKFNFWFLYLAAICDDLGIPNLKTLARMLWRKIRQKKGLNRFS